MTEPANEAGLHEYMDAEMHLTDPDSPKREQLLHEVLEKMEGVEEVSFFHGKIWVHYEPVATSEKKLLAALEAAGLHIDEVRAIPSSPLTAAFEEAHRRELDR